MRLTILCRREAGEPASPEQWKDRILPKATERWAFGQIVDAEALGEFWGRLMRRVKKEDGSTWRWWWMVPNISGSRWPCTSVCRHKWYRERLHRGLVIGRGTVEGACKNMVGARLKINSCRWRVEQAERMTALRSLDYAGWVDTYWVQRVTGPPDR